MNGAEGMLNAVPPPVSPAAIVLDALRVTLDGHCVVDAVSGSFAPGSLTAIVGPNGAGKSTLLRAMLGLVPCASGQVSLACARQAVAYLPQRDQMTRDFPISVLDCVLLGFWREVGLWRRVSRAQRQLALQALDEAGLAALAHRPVGELSSGQFQRMLFVRTQLQDAPIILLDEPFTALDEATTARLLTQVAQWHAQGRTVIAVLHDYAQVRAHFPETLLFAHAPLAWGPTASVLVPAQLGRLEQAMRGWQQAQAA